MSELPATREALIWRLAISIAEAEGKYAIDHFADCDRSYISEVFSHAKELVDGARRKGPTEQIAEAQRSKPPGWMGR
ncbi:hypothetical protein [Asaia bogorensis]|uniref:hypothetical protein n=1 Tax=Asaia bogorensis TaxID=91915 RepID=UPI003018FAC9